MGDVPALGQHNDSIPQGVRGAHTIELHEILQPGPAQGLANLLDIPMPEEELPSFWQWVYLLDRPAQADTGRDGHPARHSDASRHTRH